MLVNLLEETIKAIRENHYEISNVSHVVLSPNYKVTFEAFSNIAKNITYQNVSSDTHINTNVKVVFNDGNYLARVSTYSAETGYEWIEHWTLNIMNSIEDAPENREFLESLICC